MIRRILEVNEKPNGWSKSAYYRLRSACGRFNKVIKDSDIEVSDDNIDELLVNIDINIKHRDAKFKYSRTNKTYIGEIKRYYRYLKLKLYE